jgi:N-acylglucosamine 2-epimerase
MLSELASLYRSNLFESVIPFWMRHSLDPKFGGYFTCLERDGAVYDTHKYIWLNGRQVWTLSRLYNSVEKRSEWLDAARQGAEFLRRHAFDTQGRCWFSLTREGVPSAYQRKPYGAAFVALGFSEYGKASGDEWYRTRALDLLERIQAWIADPRLLGRDAVPGATAYSQLADVYVLASLALELDRPEILRSCLEKIALHYEPSRRLLLESAATDSALRTAYPEGRLVCAGSIFEISWILFRALDLIPDAKVEAMLLASIEGALEFCWDREFGGFYYFQDLEGRPTLQLESDMKLWWVHAEALCALLCAYQRTRDSKWLGWLERVHEWTWRRFPDEEHGEWFGYLNRAGSPTHTLKGNNYKGCFHIPRALMVSLDQLAKVDGEP